MPLLIDALPRVFAAVPESRCVLVGGPAEAAAEYRARLGSDASKLVVLAGQTPSQVVALTAPRGRAGAFPAGVPRELFSAEQDRRLSGCGAADRGDRISATTRSFSGETGAGLLAAVAPEPLADAIVRVLRDPALAARLAAATGAVAREYFAMDRNIERYLDVYYRALVGGAEVVRGRKHTALLIGASAPPSGGRLNVDSQLPQVYCY